MENNSTMEIEGIIEEKQLTFAQVLKDIQGDKSKEAFAGLLSVSVPTVYHWYNGTRSPNVENIRQLLRVAMPLQGVELLESLELVPPQGARFVLDSEIYS